MLHPTNTQTASGNLDPKWILYEFYQAQIASCDLQIEQCLASFGDKVDVTKKPLAKPKRRGTKQSGNAPQFDLRTHLYRLSGVDFTQIDDRSALTVLTLLSELGLDPSRFPPVKHFTSWLGLCPGSRITGGKVKSSKTRPVVNRAEEMRFGWQHKLYVVATQLWEPITVLCKLGWVHPRQLLLLPTKSARIFYRLWTSGDAYTDPGIDTYEQQYRDRLIKNLKRKAQALGLELIQKTSAMEYVS